MSEKLLLREILVLSPLVAAQIGICFELLRRARGSKRARAMAILGVAAIAVSVLLALLSNAWMFFKRLDGSFWLFVSNASGFVFMWLFASGPAFLIYLLYRQRLRAISTPVSPERRTLLHAAGAAAVASPFAAMAYGVLIGRRDFRIREVSLAVPGLHPDLEDLRILHLSDIHMGEFLSERDFARVVDLSNSLRPHLAIMTGDLVTMPDDPLDTCIRQLARVRADAGMIGCLGNHELYIGQEQYVKAAAATRGIQFLRHENRQLRFGKALLNIGGVDYQRASRRQDYLKGAGGLLSHGALNIMLSHNPDVFPVAADQGWDVTLSGHTHGGQVTLEIVEQTVNVARFFTPYVAGEYHLGKASCYVTRGIGTVGLPARVGVPPEITLLRLRKA